jgi:hypothetical protein
MTRYLPCFLLAGWLLPATLVWAEEAKPASVPFEILKTKHMAVKIKVNGAGPYRVIFDTGAPFSLIGSKIAKDAGLITAEAASKPAFMGMRGQMKVKTLELGELKVEEMTVMVMDHPAVKAISEILGPVDGILGFPFWARYRMTMDYQTETMTFVPVNYQPPDVMQQMMTLMLAPPDRVVKKYLAPTTVWGVEVDKAASDENPGVTIKTVLAGSAAEAAGLKPGDRLLELDSHWTDTVIDCHRAAAGVRAGQSVKARLKRGDKEIEATITPQAGL